MTVNRRRGFSCDVRASARIGCKRLGLGERRILAVQDLLVSLRITVRKRVNSCESLSGLGLLLVVISTYDNGKFVDGDIGARVGDGRKSVSVTVWLKTDGGVVEGDTGGGGNVWRRIWRVGRGGAIVERTRGQTKETHMDVGVGLGLGGGCREINGDGDGNGNVFCADGVTTV